MPTHILNPIREGISSEIRLTGSGPPTSTPGTPLNSGLNLPPTPTRTQPRSSGNIQRKAPAENKPMSIVVLAPRDLQSRTLDFILTDKGTGEVVEDSMTVAPEVVTDNPQAYLRRRMKALAGGNLNASFTIEPAPRLDRTPDPSGPPLKGHTPRELLTSVTQHAPFVMEMLGAGLSKAPGTAGAVVRGAGRIAGAFPSAPGPAGTRLRGASSLAKTFPSLAERVTTKVTPRTAVGAGVGRVAGESLDQSATGDVGLLPEGRNVVLDELERIGTAGVEASMFEMGAGVVGRVLGKLWNKYFAANPVDISDQARNSEVVLSRLAAKQGMKKGRPAEEADFSLGEKMMDPTTGKPPTSRIVPTIESFIQDFPIFASDIFKSRVRRNRRIIQTEVDSIVDRVEKAGGVPAVVNLFVDEAIGKKSMTRRMISAGYQSLEAMTEGITVPTKRIKALMASLSASRRKGVPAIVDILKSTDDAVRSLGGELPPGLSVFDRIMGVVPSRDLPARFSDREWKDGGRDISFSQAGAIRSELLGYTRFPTTDDNRPAQAIATQVVQELTRVLDDAAVSLSPEAGVFYQNIKDFARESHRDLLTGSLKKGEALESAPALLSIAALHAMRLDPKAAASLLLKPNSAGTIDAIKLLVPEARWEGIKDVLFRQLIQGNSSGTNPIEETAATVQKFNGSRVIAEMDALGPDTVEALLGREGERAMRGLAEAMQITDQNVSGMGEFAMRIAAIGAVGTLGSIGFDVITFSDDDTNTRAMQGAGLVIIAPGLLAKLIRNPGVMRRLERGYTVARSDPDRGAEVIRRALSLLSSEKYEGVPQNVQDYVERF